MADFTVTLDPNTPSQSGPRDYVRDHTLNLTASIDAGKTVEFVAKNSEFVLLIPDANDIFTNVNQDEVFRLDVGGTNTLTLKNPLSVLVQEYAVYCQSNTNFANNPGSSPPKIVVA